jgi:hypothetical protein
VLPQVNAIHKRKGELDASVYQKVKHVNVITLNGRERHRPLRTLKISRRLQ